MSKRARNILIGTLILLGLLFWFGRGSATQAKVTICHATSSESNPWVRIVVSENAIKGHFDNPGTPLAGHEDDELFEGDVACPAVVKPPVNEDTPVTSTPTVTTNKPSTPETASTQAETMGGK